MCAQVAANLMTDEMLMRSAQLTPEYRPLVDFHAQYSTVQNQKGWRYGCARSAPGHNWLPASCCTVQKSPCLLPSHLGLAPEGMEL
jgi:hypothetical protein